MRWEGVADRQWLRRGLAGSPIGDSEGGRVFGKQNKMK